MCGSILPDFAKLSEIHNALYCCYMRTKPRPQIAYTENVVKFGEWPCSSREQRNRHTNTLILILCTLTRDEVMVNSGPDFQ